jgi:hypothetical protein
VVLPLVLCGLIAVPVSARALAGVPATSHHVVYDTTAPGERVVRAMHDRYVGKWFKTMTLTQVTTQMAADGSTRTSTWHETVSLPGILRIDVGDPRDGNGVLYTRDSVFRIRGGQVAFKAGTPNELMPFMFDVYVVPVERTLASARALGVNVNVMHHETWEGRPVYVVGADSGDVHAPQVWIDKERLVLVRQIERLREDTTRLLDVQLSQFQLKGASWIATQVRIAINDKLVQTEQYQDIKLDVPLSPDVFDVTKWTTGVR